MLGYLALLIPLAVWLFVIGVAPSGKISQGSYQGSYLKEMVARHHDEVVAVYAVPAKGLFGRIRFALCIEWADGQESIADVDSTTYVLIKQQFENLCVA